MVKYLTTERATIWRCFDLLLAFEAEENKQNRLQYTDNSNYDLLADSTWHCLGILRNHKTPEIWNIICGQGAPDQNLSPNQFGVGLRVMWEGDAGFPLLPTFLGAALPAVPCGEHGGEADPYSQQDCTLDG